MLQHPAAQHHIVTAVGQGHLVCPGTDGAGPEVLALAGVQVRGIAVAKRADGPAELAEGAPHVQQLHAVQRQVGLELAEHDPCEVLAHLLVVVR